MDDATLEAELPVGDLPTQGAEPAAEGSASASASASRMERLCSDLLDGVAGPTRLLHYVLLHRLGRGGTGVVYAAYDEKLDRKVAVKLWRQGRDKGPGRLVREAKAMARLADPNVAQVYEIGEVEGLTFIVMEFVDGVTLKRWLVAMPRSRREILAVFQAAGSGLRGAHAKGLVHRDFKPENVMLRDDGRVLVLDFGIARIDDAGPPLELELGSKVDSLSGTTSTLTRDRLPTDPVLRAVTGTPAYMAPEQFLGRETDARTDQWSFCVALWEALHGQRPYMGGTVAELCLAVTQGRRTMPEHGTVPAWLRKVLERGLAVDPAERWPSMDVLLEAMAADPTRRRRWIATAAGAGVLVAAGLGGTYVVREQRRAEAIAACEAEAAAIGADWSDETRRALEQGFLATELPFAASAWERAQERMGAYARDWSQLYSHTCREARVEAQRSEAAYAQVADCLDERRATFAGLVGAWAEADDQAVIRATTAATSLPSPSTCTSDLWLARRIDPPAASRVEVAALRERLERVAALQLVGSYDHALAEAQASLQAAQALGWRPLKAEAELMVGDSYEDLGKYEEAREATWQAFLEALGGGHDLVMLQAAVKLTAILGPNLARHEEALRWGQHGAMLIERLELGETVHQASLLRAIGAVQWKQGAYDEALASLERALEIDEAALGPEHPDIAASLKMLGNVEFERGAYDRALARYQRALSIKETVLGPDHPDIAGLLDNIGAVRGTQGARDEALELHQRALSIKEAALGPEHPAVAGSLVNVGVELQYRGERTRALASYERALRIWEATLGPDHPHVASVLNNIGNIHTKLGAHEQALAAQRRALAIIEATSGPDHPLVATLHVGMGNVLSEQGATDDALQTFRRGLELTERSLGPDHPNIALFLVNIGNVLRRQGRLEEALDHYQRALALLEAKLGPDHLDVAEPLVQIGLTQAQRSALTEARAALERALSIRERGAAPVGSLGEARFELAKVLWVTGERVRSRELAVAGRDALREQPEGRTEELAEAEAWLLERPEP
jgi:tetratricopeptide (TPR) repeat protein/predicted Ser/Thr protein kinase